jgi:hypothetical protein
MYLQSREGLGEDPKETSSGDIVGNWLAEQLPRIIARVIGLKIKFRRSLADFRVEVTGAVARWVPSPHFARQLVSASEDQLKALHQQMLTEGVPDKTPMRLMGSFFYQVPDGHWRVVKVLFPAERVRWEIIKASP